jgi:hypothetical protein
LKCDAGGEWRMVRESRLTNEEVLEHIERRGDF